MAKKNLLKIPPAIEARLKTLESRYVFAACSRVYATKQLAAGDLKHLGIRIKDGQLEFRGSVIPPASQGKYSSRNVNGYEIVRRDLPKETHYNSVETPNWGDSYYGTHLVDLPYEKYPRDLVAPQLREIKVTAPDPANREKQLLIFEVDEVLDRRSRKFRTSLLECLNLLQENVGACGIQKSGATLADYLRTLQVSWEVLPPGTKEDAVARVFRGRQPSPEERTAVEERYNFLMGLAPKKLVYGTSGLQRYFGALIKDDLVVFDNIEYGNAIYVMFADWEDLSKRTRTELLSGRYGCNFVRVPHVSGWKGAVRALIKQRVDKK